MDEVNPKVSFLLRRARMKMNDNNETLHTAEARAHAFKAENEKLLTHIDALRKLIKATREEHDYLSKQISSLETVYQYCTNSIEFTQLNNTKTTMMIEEYGQSQKEQEKKCSDLLRKYEEYFDDQKAELLSKSASYQVIKQKRAELQKVKIDYMMKKQHAKEVERMNRQRKEIRKKIFQRQVVRFAEITVYAKLLASEKELMRRYFKCSTELQERASKGNLKDKVPKVAERSAGKDTLNLDGKISSNLLMHTNKQKSEHKENVTVKSTPEPPIKAVENKGLKFLIESAYAFPRTFFEAPSQKATPMLESQNSQNSKIQILDVQVVKPKNPEKKQMTTDLRKRNSESFSLLQSTISFQKTKSGKTFNFDLNRSLETPKKMARIANGASKAQKSETMTVDGPVKAQETFKAPRKETTHGIRKSSGVGRAFLDMSFLAPSSQENKRETTLTSQELAKLLSQENQLLVENITQESSQRTITQESGSDASRTVQGNSQESNGVLNGDLEGHNFENDIGRYLEANSSQFTATAPDFSQNEGPQPSNHFVFKQPFATPEQHYDSQHLQDNASQNMGYEQYNNENMTSPGSVEIPEWLARSPPSDNEFPEEDEAAKTFFTFGKDRKLFG